MTSDAVVIGDGVVGLSTALQLARSGLRCHVLGARQPGAASSAAAGLLAPNIGNLAPNVRALFRASLALYPQYLAPLTEIDAGLRLLSGLIEVLDEHGPLDEHHLRLEQQTLDALQPGVMAPYGAVLHEADAAIDNVRLLAALRSCNVVNVAALTSCLGGQKEEATCVCCSAWLRSRRSLCPHQLLHKAASQLRDFLQVREA